jgi:hypothetical protein
MKMKYLIGICILAAACGAAIPEPLIERARLICEPYGGLDQVWNYRVRTEISFRCANGDQHVLLPINLENPNGN